MAKRVIILGATGSIGLNAIDVIRSHPGEFEVTALSALRSREQCEALARELGAKAYVGEDSALRAVEECDADICLVATVGMSGIRPTLAAIAKGMDIALATKEVMVMAGELVTAEAKRRGVKFLPVDSEHSAIFQCIGSTSSADVSKLILTASGGPFLDAPADLSTVTVSQALDHPRWKMGPKVTVDSSTMMNKGFEMIEAMHLFHVRPEQIEVVVHRESIVHSLVEFRDGSVLAQLSPPDMRLPIQYAVDYPARQYAPRKRLDLASIGKLTFFAPDEETFPAMKLCREVMEKGGSFGAAVNGANEVAVAAFLAGKIPFGKIYPTVEQAARAVPFFAQPTLNDIFETDRQVRAAANLILK